MHHFIWLLWSLIKPLAAVTPHTIHQQAMPPPISAITMHLDIHENMINKGGSSLSNNVRTTTIEKDSKSDTSSAYPQDEVV